MDIIETDTNRKPSLRNSREVSRAALESIPKETHEKRRSRILRLIDERRGLTCDEIEIETGGLHQTVSSAITALRRRGKLHDTGERRATRYGCQAIVWGAGR